MCEKLPDKTKAKQLRVWAVPCLVEFATKLRNQLVNPREEAADDRADDDTRNRLRRGVKAVRNAGTEYCLP